MFSHLYHTAVPEMVMSVDKDMILRITDKKIVLGSIQTRMVCKLCSTFYSYEFECLDKFFGSCLVHSFVVYNSQEHDE